MTDRPEERIAAVVLAGGRGRRMGGMDKGLVKWRGRPLAAHVLEAVKPQVDRILISANRNLEHYRAFGHPVVRDTLEGFRGPLAGILAAMEATDTPLLLSLPCDAPLVPPDLAVRLLDALRSSGAEVAAAHDGRRLQPVHALWRTTLAPELARDLAAGRHGLTRWLEARRLATVDFSDCPEAFRNFNRPRDLLERAGNGAGIRPDRR